MKCNIIKELWVNNNAKRVLYATAKSIIPGYPAQDEHSRNFSLFTNFLYDKSCSLPHYSVDCQKSVNGMDLGVMLLPVWYHDLQRAGFVKKLLNVYKSLFLFSSNFTAEKQSL